MTAEKKPKKPKVLGPLDSPAWYWYQCEPCFVSHVDNVLTARGYNFNSHEEWSKPVSEMRREDFIQVEKIILQEML